MREGAASKRPVLLVLSSTYPRWSGDHEPGFVHELARRLTSTFDVIAVVPRAPGAVDREVLDGVAVVRYGYAPRRFETLVNDGGIVTNLKRHRWKWLLVAPFCLGQAWHAFGAIARERPAVIHAHWLLPQGIVAAALRVLSKRTPPFVVTSHGADLFALRGRLFGALRKWVVERAAALTVVSEAMRSALESTGARAKITVQPMGIDLRERFAPDPATARSRDELLFVGRLVEKKGLRHLIDALPKIRERHPGATLTVAGFGPEEAALRARVGELDLGACVTFLGAVPQAQLPELYRRAAVFVAPFVTAKSGDQEGFGLVLVEALGCGCPVVASALPATRDVLSGLAGAIAVEPGNTDALADAVGTILAGAHAYAERAASDRDSLIARFDWSTVADGYAATLRSVA
ncbi:MAG TPA: glycosyltransferase [Rhodanobacteraceae bacterium]|nr:glycosyltransferase [Rhodanobacteraceae bacterium]